ncbi:unnamed protein product [Peniophora sp. CBMAI 1063]|nr:unnamed protein product [Peniophora sp. CBMAI 1063]
MDESPGCPTIYIRLDRKATLDGGPDYQSVRVLAFTLCTTMPSWDPRAYAELIHILKSSCRERERTGSLPPISRELQCTHHVDCFCANRSADTRIDERPERTRTMRRNAEQSQKSSSSTDPAHPEGSSTNSSSGVSPTERDSGSTIYLSRACSITRHDLRLLQPGKVLNDELINFGMEYLVKTSEFCSSFLCLSTMFATLLKARSSFASGDPVWAGYWSRWKPLEKPLLLIPVNNKTGYHWYLLFVALLWDGNEPTGVSVTWLDSCRDKPHLTAVTKEMSMSLGRFIVNKARERLGIIGLDHTPPTERVIVREASVPIQDNECDCGLHVLKNASTILRNPSRAYELVFAPSYWGSNDCDPIRARLKDLLGKYCNGGD